MPKIGVKKLLSYILSVFVLVALCVLYLYRGSISLYYLFLTNHFNKNSKVVYVLDAEWPGGVNAGCVRIGCPGSTACGIPEEENITPGKIFDGPMCQLSLKIPDDICDYHQCRVINSECKTVINIPKYNKCQRCYQKQKDHAFNQAVFTKCLEE